MALSRTTTKIERASLKKATVSTVPLWAQQELAWNRLSEEDEGQPEQGQHLRHIPSSLSSLSSLSTRSLSRSASRSTNLTSATSFTRASSAAGSTKPATWSVFATMSNVSTISERLSQIHHQHTVSASSATPSDLSALDMEGGYYVPEQLKNGRVQAGSRGFTRQSLTGLFRISTEAERKTHAPSPSPAAVDSTACTCRCTHHRIAPPHSHQHRLSRVGPSSTLSHKRLHKHSVQLTRGYPTGRCVSSAEPPKETTWDEKDDPDDLLDLQSRRHTFWTNTAFNLETAKMFLNSPLFSNILKILTVLAAVSLFAIALDALLILQKTSAFAAAVEGEHQQRVLYDNTSLVLTVALSVLTVIYSCFTIMLESRRQPEGLDNTSTSKPLIVIFSEIIASIIWAQVLSVTIYIYHWTYGCVSTAASAIDQDGKPRTWWLWNQEGALSDPYLTERLCRRQGSMVGLELLLVLLLIFNFYTHLAQNFRFIRAVSR